MKQLTANDVNKAGYITFTRKDKGIACRTEAIAITDQDYTFTFLDTTVVEEVGNSGNKRRLDQIDYSPKVAIASGGRNVTKNDIVNRGETLVNNPKQTEFTLKNTGAVVLEINLAGKGDNNSSLVRVTAG
jgi:hypothetical protein